MLEVLKLMFPYLRPFWKQALTAALLALPLSAIKAYEAYLVKDIFDKGFSAGSTSDEAFKLAAILVGLGILNYPLRFFHYYGLRMIVDRCACSIRSQLFNKFQAMPSSYFAQAKQGNLVSTFLSDTNMFADSFKNALEIIREPITAIALVSVAFYHDWQLALIILVASPIFALIFGRLGRRIRKYIGQAQKDVADMTHSVSEALTGQRIAKAFGLQPYLAGRFEKVQERFLGNRSRSNSAEEHSHPAVELVGSVAFAGVIVFAQHRIASGELTTGGFISFVAALAMFMDPIRKFSKASAKLNQARAASTRILSLLDTPIEPDTGRHHQAGFKEKIEFKNLSFSYGDREVLKNFNLVIKKGEKIGLVGLSGSGKSTLVSLLLRLYPVSSGEILVDGVNINDWKLADLRKLFSLVSQDIFLFNDTVRENLTTGEEASDEEIIHALEVSYAKDFVLELPEQLQTVIGDRGLRLSGGQAQRLTIARAFLKNRDIMLFDEATSALDNESEKTVQAALARVAGHKTVVAVAHRLSTLKNYDRIVVLKEGKKVEEGSHEELMNTAGEYRKLYELSQRD
ncbi:MAG: ABC transporter ATP-binding protein [Bacteriovoracia bacterium]